jgi:hypothetical protein
MLVSVVASVKEFKLYFQYATNRHVKTALMTFCLYCGMVLVSFPAVQWFGLIGFTVVWLAVECLQLTLVHSHNARFFERPQDITFRPAVRLALVLAVMSVVVLSLRPSLQIHHDLLLATASCLLMLLLAGASYFLFNLDVVVREGKGQLLRFTA